MSLGVPGGFRMMGKKYGNEDGDAEKERTISLIADGVDKEIANRPEEFGNTVDSVVKFRDRAFADILKNIHHKI